MDGPLIYIVDDDPISARTMAGIASSIANCKEFHSASEALAAFPNDKPAIVLSDIKMPEMDGLTLLQKIKEIEEETVVIMISGQGEMNDVITAMRGGAFDYVQKDSPLDITKQVMKKALRRIEMQSELAEAKKTARLHEGMAQLGVMVSSIVHEIKNPLFKADLKLKKIKKRILDEYDPLIKDEVCKIEDLLDRVFKIIKSQSNLYRHNEESPADFCEVGKSIEDAINICEAIFVAGYIKFERAISDSELTVQGGRIEIGQILINIIINASHAIEELPERWVKLTGEKVEGFYELRVIDSGKGIDPKLVKKIFEPHFTTKKIGEGTGLGLSTSKRLAKSFGGDITVDHSNPNTCFVIRFPLKSDSEAQIPA